MDSRILFWGAGKSDGEELIMETKPRYMLVGSFVLVLALFGVLFVLWYSKLDFNDGSKLYQIYFDGSVSGLRVNEEVRFQGIPLGKVQKISVDKNDVERVKVLVSIAKPELIREDTTAMIEAQGLTGYSFVQLKPGDQFAPLLTLKKGQKYPIIKSRRSSIESIFAEAPKSLKNLGDFLGKLGEMLDDSTVKDIQGLSKNLNKISQELSSGQRSVSVISQELVSTLKQLKEMTATISAASKKLEGTVDDTRPGLKEFSQEGLPEISRLVRQTKESMKALERLLHDARESPGALINKNTQQGYVLQ